jgi:hypothetical protein
MAPRKRITPVLVQTYTADANVADAVAEEGLRIVTGPLTAAEAAAKSSLGPARRIYVDLTKTTQVNWREVRGRASDADRQAVAACISDRCSLTSRRSWWQPTRPASPSSSSRHLQRQSRALRLWQMRRRHRCRWVDPPPSAQRWRSVAAPASTPQTLPQMLPGQAGPPKRAGQRNIFSSVIDKLERTYLVRAAGSVHAALACRALALPSRLSAAPLRSCAAGRRQRRGRGQRGGRRRGGGRGGRRGGALQLEQLPPWAAPSPIA